jgi:hypothetical protein
MVWCDRRSRRHPRSRKRFLYALPDAPPTIRHQFFIGRQDARFPPLHRKGGKLQPFTLFQFINCFGPTHARICREYMKPGDWNL